jgi:anti-sigma factor RsiW
MDSLEEYLSGTLEPAGHREIEAHLSSCPMCRQEVESMQEVSQLFGTLKSDEAAEPLPGFYASVIQEVGRRKSAPSFATLFGFDFAFGRRVVFASLLTLAFVGGFLVMREAESPGGASPEVVMAQQNSPSFDTASGGDNMLATLTAYEQH